MVRRHLLMSHCLGIALYLLTSASSLADGGKPTIHWLNPNWPPYWISEGEFKGTGAINIQIKSYEENIPEFQYVHHENIVFSRQALMFKDTSKTYCNAGIVRGSQPDLDNNAQFSDEILPFPAIRLIVSNPKIIEKFQTLAKDGQISITDLVTNHEDIRIGYEQNTGWEGLLPKDASSRKNVIVVGSGDASHLKMLFSNRIDYALEYEASTTHFLKTKKMDVKFSSFFIKEVPRYIFYGVACNKTSTGTEFIAKLNDKLPKLRFAKGFISAIIDLLTESGSADVVKFSQERYGNDKRIPLAPVK